MTEAVPKLETVKEAADFNTEIKPVKNGKVTIPLRKVPVFVEELQ